MGHIQNKVACVTDRIGEGIGVGILAGLAGTVAITISQTIEMKLTKRTDSTGPANAVEKTLPIQSKPGEKKKLANSVHWTYGTIWGIARGLLAVAGIKRWTATGAHFAAILGTAMAMAPLEGQKPVTEWKPKDFAIDALHHAVYAIATGLVFDAITSNNE